MSVQIAVWKGGIVEVPTQDPKISSPAEESRGPSVSGFVLLFLRMCVVTLIGPVVGRREVEFWG